MKNFFKAKDEWDSAHSHIWVYGATAEQMINAAKEYEDYEEYFFNDTENDGLVYFDMDSGDNRGMCDELSAHIEGAIFFGFCSWDENDFYASKNGSHFTGYSVRTDESPFIDEPSILEDFEEEDFCELQYEGIFCWEFTVLDEKGKELFSIGSGDFALQEIDDIWNKR